MKNKLNRKNTESLVTYINKFFGHIQSKIDHLAIHNGLFEPLEFDLKSESGLLLVVDFIDELLKILLHLLNLIVMSPFGLIELVLEARFQIGL